MKTLYIECSMGCAGDMLTGALLELLPDPDDVIRLINRAGIPGVTVSRERAESHGIVGTHVAVKIDGHDEDEATEGQRHHHHAGMADIEAIINSLNAPIPIKNHVRAVYSLIAEAESKVHGVPVSEVHFHEVGMADAIADILGVSLILERLGPDEIVVSPVHVGSGRVKCAHGWLPVPAPATAEILKGVPIYSADVDGELCTPTGAAFKAFCHPLRPYAEDDTRRCGLRDGYAAAPGIQRRPGRYRRERGGKREGTAAQLQR